MAIPMTLNPIGRSGGEPYFSLIVKPGILGGMEYGFTPYWNEGGYCRVLDWGDGVAENAVTSRTVIKHTYTTAGTYRIKIIGDCWRVVFGQNPVYAELVYDSNGQWKFLGTLTSGEFMFWQCRNAIYTFQHFPDYITNIAYMFADNYNAHLQFKEFADTIINCTAAFNVCQKSRLQFKNIPALKELVHLFYNNNNSGINIADELGVGLSFRKGDKWSVELNYLRSGWNASGMDSAPGFAVKSDVDFSTTATNSIRAGFEIVPNRNDIRYYGKRITYRAGAYYDQSYYKLDGNRVDSFGVTLGASLPINRLYNGITVGVDIGQKGSLKHSMVRERYVMFVIGFNIHDLWFHKPKYE